MDLSVAFLVTCSIAATSRPALLGPLPLVAAVDQPREALNLIALTLAPQGPQAGVLASQRGQLGRLGALARCLAVTARAVWRGPGFG